MSTERRDKLGRRRTETQGKTGNRHMPIPTFGRITGTLTVADMPEGLTPKGAEFWLAARAEMERMGILESMDRFILQITTDIWENIQQATADIKKHGEVIECKTGMKRNPAFSTLREARPMLRSCLMELGLTPSARAKLGGPAEDDDPFAELVREMNAN